MTDLSEYTHQAAPLVSIVMALYNSEKYVEESLMSLINQTYKNIEIIVVNDGSTDKGAEVVQSIMQIDSRIRLYDQLNKGQCAASNFGFKQARGEYIKFFDADDILTKRVIESQVQTLLGKGEFEGAFMDYVRFYDDDVSTVDKFPRHELIKKDCSPIEYITFTGSPPMYNNAIWLFSRKIFETTGLWDERLSVNNDGEFFPRVLKFVRRLYYTPNEMVYYRTNSNSLSQKISEKGIKSALLSVDLMAVHIRSMAQSPTIEMIIARSYVQVLNISFPFYTAITKAVEERLRSFPISYYSFLSTGKVYNLFVKLFGWKVAKRFQLLYYKCKYSTKAG